MKVSLSSKFVIAIYSIWKSNVCSKVFSPSWEDLDTRTLPKWYDSAKIGIIIHWGPYSVPGYGNETFWLQWRNNVPNVTNFVLKNYPKQISYKQFGSMLTGEFYDPKEWAELFHKSGAKYVVLTAKHHDAYALFPSMESNGWNSVNMGPKADIVKTLSGAVEQFGMKFGVHYSLFEWFNRLYFMDKSSKFETQKYVDTKVWPEIKQLVTDYKPHILWSRPKDGEAPDWYWRPTELLAWLYNESPVRDELVVNIKWRSSSCLLGGFYNCNDTIDPIDLKMYKWERVVKLVEGSSGFRRNQNINDVQTMKNLLVTIVTIVSCGGNALINVGPTKEGVIEPIEADRLLQLGKWLSINGEAIYDSSPWMYNNDTFNEHLVFTCRKDSQQMQSESTNEAVYAIFFQWPSKNTLVSSKLGHFLRKDIHKIDFLSPERYTNLRWEIVNVKVNRFTLQRAYIQLPSLVNITGSYAWTIKIYQD